MTEISRKIEIKFGDLFCSNDRFELDMVGVFNAYEDFCNFSKMITAVSNHDLDVLFISKWSFVYVKEANTLLSETIFKKHKAKIKKFANKEEIFELKEDYKKYKDKYFKILKGSRNYSTHYSNMYDENRTVLSDESLKNANVEICISNEMLESNVFNSTYYTDFAKNLYVKNEDFNKEIKALGDFVNLMRKLLKALAEGYLCYKYDFCQDKFHEIK